MICNNCGAENKETAKFCKNCGKELVEVKVMPEAESRPSSAMERKCPACGTSVGANAVFCKKCGHKIDEPVSATSDDDVTTVLQPDADYDYEYESVMENTPGESDSGGKAGNSYMSESAYTQSYGQTYDMNTTEDQLPPKYKPIGAWAYFGWSLLFSLPIAGIIIAIVFAVGSTENINLRNFARAQFCLWAIIGILVLLIFASAGCTMAGFYL